MFSKPTLGLLVSSGLASFGAWIDFLAILTLAAYGFQANALWMAFLSALFLLPALTLAPALGRWVDRGRPGPILIGSLLLRAAATALLLAAPSLWVFCLLVALRSTFSIPADPASHILVGRWVAKDQVPRYFGILGVLRNSAKIAAPAMGTAMASIHGEGVALSLSIAMAVIAAAIVAVCIAGDATVTADDRTVQDVSSMAGVAAPPSNQIPIDRVLLARLLCTVTIFAFVVFFINNQFPVLLRDAGFDRALLGVLVSCSGAGGILAAIYMTKSNAAVRAKDPMTATTLSAMAVAASFVALGLAFMLPLSAAPWVASAIFFTTGVFSSIEAIRSGTVLVQNFASHTGEVSGHLQSCTSAAMLVAPWLAAGLIPHVTLPVLLVGNGAIGMAALAVTWIWFAARAEKGRGI